ncbi:MAG: SulP family inorganic anion transporter [Acidimicrobiales bacterium]|nr:SulP family inorganic anion transporter [Acidimicrobiales bacterium]
MNTGEPPDGPTDADIAAGAKKRRLPVLEGILPVERSRLPIDILAGTTLAALGIPEVMGYAKIAGMPVVTGLYTILIPIAVFALLGSSRHLVVGADSATAAILAAGLAGLAATGSDEYVALAAGVAIVTGGVLVLARLIGLGFLADFLSRSVLIGFLTGVGIQVAMGQVAGMLGVSDGSGGTIRKFVNTLENIGDANGPTLAVSAGVLVTILGCRAIDKRIPGALIAVIGAIVVSWQLDLADDGVSVLGTVPGGLPSFGLPDVGWSDLPSLLSTVGAIVLVILAQSAATARAYAARYQESFSEDTDLIGLGAANAAAGLSGTFVVNGSPTKTQMVDGAGGRSQLATLTTGVVVLVVLLFLTGPLEYLPNAVLAAVVFLIGVELVDVSGMRGILKVRRDEFWIAVLTAVVVVVVGVEQGVVLAIIASIADYVRRGYRPPRALLVEGPRGHLHGHPLDSGMAMAPGLLVYRFGADLFYANANAFAEDLIRLAGTPGARWLCVDAAGISDVDFSGSKALGELHEELHERGVRLVLAAVNGPVRAELDRYGLTAQLGADAIFLSIDDALTAFDQLPPPSPSPSDRSPTTDDDAADSRDG